MVDFNVAVVIPAAGKSERLPGESPKQYISVLGKPLFLYCVEAFLNVPYIKRICVVSDRVEYVEQLFDLNGIRQEKILIVPGGSTRHASIKNGLNALEKIDMYLKVVIVHDGARPVVPADLVTELVLAASIHGAAGATRPLTSTVIRPQSDGFLEECLDRAAHVASETPQAFLFEMLCDAYQKCSSDDIEHGTECLQLALNYCGIRAKLIPGPHTLWKVTQKKDSHSAVACLREMSTRVCLLAEKENDLVRSLKDNLEEKVAQVGVYVTGQHDHGHTSPTSNTVVCFHDNEIHQDSQIILLSDVLDIDTPGIIIHVVIENSEDGLITGSVYDLIRSGRSMMTQYEKLKKGVVIIHFTSLGEEERLVRLITSLILTDSNIFSGQTLFL